MPEETSLTQTAAPELPGGRQGASGDPGRVPADRKITLTSHSLIINAGLFTLDLSWRRMEMDPSQSAAFPPAAAAPAIAAPSFKEILRRQQIADLLAPVSQPPEDCQLLQSADQAPPPMVPVRLAYPGQERPLVGVRSLRPSTV